MKHKQHTIGVIYDDLDWIIGSKTLDDAFDAALLWLNSAPTGLEIIGF